MYETQNCSKFHGFRPQQKEYYNYNVSCSRVCLPLLFLIVYLGDENKSLRRNLRGVPRSATLRGPRRLNPFPLFATQVQSSKSRFVPNGCIQLSQHCTNTRHELSLLLGTIILKEPGMESVIEELKMYAMPITNASCTLRKTERTRRSLHNSA
jgi:hypothetical protein